MRSDARDNRSRILDAAMRAYDADEDPSLREIARRAGVGQGTLYRHFPSRESLVLQVYWCEVQQLVASVPELLRTHRTFDALGEWLRRLARCATTRAVMAGALDTATTGRTATTALADTYGLIREALAALLSANEEAGILEAGLTADDVLLLLSFLWRIGQNREAGERTDRLLDVVLHGLRIPGDRQRPPRPALAETSLPTGSGASKR
jgi:AcrR family transcriptional regulator